MVADDGIARRNELGRLAGFLFLVGALASIPANVLFEDPSAGTLNHVLVGLAVVSGLGCFLVRWESLPEWVFHLVPPIAAGEVALTTWAVGRHGPVYEWFYVFVALFAAYAFASRRAIVVHLGLFTLAAALPLLYEDDRVGTLARLGVMVPMLWVTTAVVVHLRDGMRARQRDLAELARRDPLTGVGNRRTLDDRLGYELARHRRTSRELALIVLDLDRFKEVNDALGHPAGDRVLRTVADVLCHTIREGDTVIRHGGDEFCIVAPETGLSEAQRLGERLGAQLASIDVLGRPLTATMGIAVFPHDGPTAERLVAAADVSERTAKADARARRRTGASASV